MTKNSYGLDSIFTKRLELSSGVSVVNLATGVGKTHSAMVGIVKHINKLMHNKDTDVFSVNNVSEKGVVVYMSNNNATVLEAFKKLQEIAAEHCTGNESLSLEDFQKISCIIPSNTKVLEKYAFDAINLLEGNSKDDFNRAILSIQEYRDFKDEYNKICKYNQGDTHEERAIASHSINDKDSTLNKLFKKFKSKVDELFCLEVANIKNKCKKSGNDHLGEVLAFKYCEHHAWIEKIFPDANIYDKKVIFVTADKFFYPFSPFGEKPFLLYESDILKNGNIIIDESDTVYGTFLKLLIDNNSFNVGDIVTNVRMLISALNKNIGEELGLIHKDSDLPDKLKKKGRKIVERAEELKVSGNQISEKYNMCNDYKSTKKLASLGENVPLFHSSGTGNILFEGVDKKGFLAIKPDVSKNKNYIDAISYDDYYNEDVKGEYLNLITFIFDLVDFERKVSNCLRRMVNFNIEYRKVKNEFRSVDNRILREEAIDTVLNFFDLTSHYGDKVVFVDYLKDLIKYNTIKLPNSKKIDNSFFGRGFNYTDLKNNETHQTKSYLERTILNTTPEKMLYHLQEHSHVILISATAGLEGAYNNFILNESLERWGVDIINLSNDEVAMAQDVLDRNTNNYNKNINITIDPVENTAKKLEAAITMGQDRYYSYIRESLKDLFSNNKEYQLNVNEKRIIDNIVDRLQRLQVTEYYIGKMIQIISVYKYFVKNSSNRTILCVLNSCVKQAKYTGAKTEMLDKGVLDMSLNLLSTKYGNGQKIALINIESKNLDKNIPNVEKLVNDNTRVIIQTTYPTVSKGLNLQIKIINENIKKELVPPTTNGFYSNDKMDIGEIYFQKKTNIRTRLDEMTGEDDEPLRYSELAINKMMLFVEANRLYSLRELNDECYDSLLCKIGRNEKYISTSEFLYSGSIAQFYWIVQVIGRISRGGLKQKNIIIHYDKDIVGELSYDTLLDPKVMVTKELGAFIDSVLQEKDKDESLDSGVESSVRKGICRANTMSINAINNYLSKRADGNLSKFDIALWEKRRIPPAGTAFGFSHSINDFVGFEEYFQNYIKFEGPIKSYAYKDYDNYKSVCLNAERKKGFKEVSIESMRYDKVIKCKETKEFLKSKGYLTDIDVKTETFNILPSPAEFNNILKASLSEMICKYLLGHEGIIVSDIDDPTIHEDFDGVIEAKDIYFDFKNYNSNETFSNRSKIIRKTRKKMEESGAKATIFVNMYNPLGGQIHRLFGNIYLVNGLLKDQDGSDEVIVDYKIIKDLKEAINNLEKEVENVE